MKTLLVGYRAADLFEKGKHGRWTTASWLDGDVTCHTLDVYDRHAIEKTHHVRTICSPHLPAGPWDLVKFRTGPKLMSGELALDLLQEIHMLKPVRFELDYIGRERDRNDLLAKIRDDPGRVRDFSAKWKASVPGIAPVEFTSVPGCFCHRRLDEGGLALAEVASRELKDASSPRVLDMGCGCGLVGLLVAKAVPVASLVMVDSHSRAVEAASLNAANLGVPAEVILADNGTPARMDGTFDVFVGNPPYYSDYRIADVFLETAKRALKPGGVCYTVCKNAAGLEPVQRRYFPEVEVIRRRGYAVLKSAQSAGIATGG
ncbi:MAG: methyltransferase [Kiritimatiellae bacterium]|nr:methyltransferase [Kiritimatiellia bacterium]